VSASPRKRDGLLKWVIGTIVAGVLLGVNLPTVTSAALNAIHNYEINSHGYEAREGHWSILKVPGRFRVNAIHAALLDTGKVLIIAGSGNDRSYFNAGTFKSLIWNPATNKFKLIHTPSDMFCGGHAFLPDGKLLIAGGTKRYEVLANEVHRAAGVVTLQDQSPEGGPVQLPPGAEFVAPDGAAFRSTKAVSVPQASKTVSANGVTKVTAGEAELWVEAVQKGSGSAIDAVTHLSIAGVHGAQARNLFGITNSLTLNKQEYWGDDKSYLFNPQSENYEKVSNLQLARWYPTLVGLADGRVLAVSGLDQFGRIIQGKNEIYTPATRTWKLEPKLTRTFPTYPALFLMPSGNLFYTGSNAGYGSASVGRTPGVWNTQDNSFRIVPGLRDPNETETSGSVLLPPAQAQKYMIVGGGGVGSSPRSTARTAIADLAEPNPHWKPGPNLAQPTRYPDIVITPDGRVVITGGSSGYRGEHDSDLFECHSFDPATGKLTALAKPSVGRDYHSEAMLLPDGRIVTLGGNPLYANKADTIPGEFEKRIEIYSPPYLYHGKRPTIAGGPKQLTRGQTATFSTPDAAKIESASLLRPSAVTHVTDVEQRSIALSLTRHGNSISVRVPDSTGLVPSGWYMLFVANGQATPSKAYWVHVG
jgi:hypothetical protein